MLLGTNVAKVAGASLGFKRHLAQALEKHLALLG